MIVATHLKDETNKRAMPKQTSTSSIIEQIISQEQLPKEFAETAKEYFVPLSDHIAQCCGRRSQALVVGVNGAQGTGKSTLSLLLTQLLQARNLECVVISIDDLYLTRQERAELAQHVHPLLKTRGVPGTHDLELGLKLIAELKAATSDTKIALPYFDKAQDERRPAQHWDLHRGPVDVIVIEGWCVGALPTSLVGSPLNALEENFDGDGAWRQFVEKSLLEYQRLFSQIDLLVMLKAPSMECIIEWRTLQEEKLQIRVAAQVQARNGAIVAGASNHGVMNKTELLRFIMHYERLTRYMLETMPHYADVVFELNTAHRIDTVHYRT